MMLRPSATILDRRVLGALELIDAATGVRLSAPMRVTGEALGCVQNRSGLHVIDRLHPRTEDEAALARHLDAFDAAPGTPAAGALPFTLTITDPAGRYLPRRVTLALPRGEALNTPVAVTMYPAPAAPMGQNWSGIRATLERRSGAERLPLAGARLRLLRDSDGEVLGTGFADARGEALVPVVGLPVIDFDPTADEDTAPGGGGGGGGSGGGGGPGGGAPAPLLGTKTVTARIEIHTAAGRPWPADPDAIGPGAEEWVRTSGDMPKPKLATGRHVNEGLSLLLKPKP